MPASKANKSGSDKAQVCRTLVAALQKLYGKSLPRLDLPVLETFLFAICLEDNSWDAAQEGYQKLLSAHFDLNEVRVSSVNELEQILAPLRSADWKGLRIRSMLRHVFESTYSFEYEKFRRLTQEAAVKALRKISDLSPFVRNFALQQLLGSHVISLDSSMLNAVKWLGIVPHAMDVVAAEEFLRGFIKKAGGAEFCYLLRCLATDPRFYDRFSDLSDGEAVGEIQDRLQELQSPPKRKPSKPVSPPIPQAAARSSVKSSTAAPTRPAEKPSGKARSNSDAVSGPEKPKKAVAASKVSKEQVAARPPAAAKKTGSNAAGARKSASPAPSKSTGAARSRPQAAPAKPSAKKTPPKKK